MFRFGVCPLVFSALLVVCLAQSNEIIPRKNTTKQGELEKRDEILTLSVRIIEDDEKDNGKRKTEVMINLRVTIEEDVVNVNGKLTELDVLTSYDLDAEIVYSPTRIEMVPVTIHVLVMRQQVENGHRFLLEEKVQFIDGKDVEQVDVKILTIHINNDGKEYDRTFEMVAFEKSHIKQKKLGKFCGKGDKHPKELEDEPRLPDESGLSGRHHHHKKGKKKGICAKFHKLPFAARISIFVGVVFILFASVLTCTLCCCRKPKNVYDLHKDEKTDFEMDEEAEPLPEKLAFDDKQVLIA